MVILGTPAFADNMSQISSESETSDITAQKINYQFDNSSIGNRDIYYKWDTNDSLVSGNSTDYNYHINFDQSDLKSALTAGTVPTNVSGVFYNLNSGIDAAAVSIDKQQNVDSVNAYFIENTGIGSYGAALWLGANSEVGNINGLFIKNNIDSQSLSTYYGAGIYVSKNASIGNINADFIANSITVTYNDSDKFNIPQGGAIYVSENASITNIGSIDRTAAFTGNFVKSSGPAVNSVVAARGGAISNFTGGKIDSINAIFTNNFAKTLNSDADGGAIYNMGTIDKISEDSIFTGNYAQTSGKEAHGGAIYNIGRIDTIQAKFEENHADFCNGSGGASGGAIYNSTNGVINTIKSTFVNNYSKGGANAWGGVITNSGGNIGTITGEFQSNKAIAESYGTSKGGVIRNFSTTINKILNSTFKENYVEAGIAQGGVINNDGIINDVSNTTFTSNYALSKSSGEAQGGVIFNNKKIINIQADFYDNYTQNNSNGGTSGGAIFNGSNGVINTIEGEFAENYSQSSTSAYGGALTNSGSIGTISSDFNDNKAAANGTSRGGAVRNISTINEISNNSFNRNYAEGGTAEGGAISNGGTITKLDNTDFIGNYASSTSSSGGSYGGAIYNNSVIGKKDADGNIVSGIINSSFLNNYAKTTSGAARGGAIWTSANLNIIADNDKSEFTGNYVQIKDGEKQYEAIYVDSSTATLNMTAKNNGSIVMNDYINGSNGYGIVMNADSTSSIDLNNILKGSPNAELKNVNVNWANDTLQTVAFTSLDTIDSNYSIDLDLSDITAGMTYTIGQKADGITTAENSTGNVTLTNLNFINGSIDDIYDKNIVVQIIKNETNSSTLQLELTQEMEERGLLSSIETKTAQNLKANVNWKDKFDYKVDTLNTYGKIGLTSTNTLNDSIGVVVTRQEALTSYRPASDTLALIADATEFAEMKKSFNFDTEKDVHTVADDISEINVNGNLTINGVSTTDSETGEMSSSIVDLNKNDGIKLNGNSSLTIKDTKITNAGDNVIFANDSSAAVTIDNADIDGTISGVRGYTVNIESKNFDVKHDIQNANINLNTENVNFYDTKAFASSDVYINGGMLNFTVDNRVSNFLATSVTVNNDVNILVDADLSKQRMDRLPENLTVLNGATIRVAGINLLSDSKESSIAIPFAYKSFKDSVIYSELADLSKDTQITTAFSPIYKYAISYDNRDDAGYFVFNHAAGRNQSSAFNPAVLASPVATQIGAYAAHNEAFIRAFGHADTYMNNSRLSRMALLSPNQYAINNNNVLYSRNDMNSNSMWVQPYTNFESISLKNGPKVNTTSYGTFVGGHSDIKPLSNGWSTVTTAYAGYNGSSQSYNGVNTYQNGGILGATQTWYKGNFYTALTANAGASVGESHTMYGHENFTMLMAGIASKSGYNFDFKEGKFIVQPSMMMAYSFINTFDYTNAAGVRISSDPLNTIQLRPNIKFISNLKNGWQPYAQVGMVWNLMNNTKVTAADVTLPEMSVKPYIEYGVGVQKRWKDRITGYAQAMIRNGGRNGIALTAGFRWALGHESKPIEKVEEVNGKKLTTTFSTNHPKATYTTVKSGLGNATVLKRL
ncbi:MAG: hypothetical protein NC191_02160 [Muribaculaceae bacterium]|nr:hypothetical protein [Muribaculaceae bacterium]